MQIFYSYIFGIFGIFILQFNLKEKEFAISYRTKKLIASIETIYLFPPSGTKLLIYIPPANFVQLKKTENSLATFVKILQHLDQMTL